MDPDHDMDMDMLSLSLLLGFYMERMLEVLYQLMLLDLLMLLFQLIPSFMLLVL